MSYSVLKKKNKNKDMGILKSIAISLVAGCFIFVILLCIFSLVSLNVLISTKYLYIFVLISSCISAFFGSFITCLFLSSNRLIVGLAVAAAIAIIEFTILLCFNNASLSNSIYLLFPIDIFFGFIACIIGTNIK